MRLVDSSGWLEFFSNGPLAGDYEEHVADLDQILSSTVVLFEVYKWVKRERSEEQALVSVAQIEKTRVVPVTTTIALTAADLGLEHGLAMADSIVYATARLNDAQLITSDRDFSGLPEVVYLER